MVSSVYSLCVGHDQLELFRKLLKSAGWIPACGNAHFRVADASLRILVVDGAPGFRCLVVLQLHLEPSEGSQGEGTPSHIWQPTGSLLEYISPNVNEHRRMGDVSRLPRDGNTNYSWRIYVSKMWSSWLYMFSHSIIMSGGAPKPRHSWILRQKKLEISTKCSPDRL